ncbi:MAG: HEPN domain-containing protein [Nitrospiraceae bacterium]|nr:MAG: HEPN domain-containing protein [Nitrospiraceae bacterium]
MVKEIGRAEKKSYIKGALDLSREKAEAAIDAYKRGNYGQVLSSLYYSYFHIIKSLLYEKGFDPKSHEGVYAMLNLHFIKPGALDKKVSRLFEKLHKNREIVDYNPLAPKFDRSDADQFLHEFMELTPSILTSLHNYKSARDNIIHLLKELTALKNL